MNNFEAFDRLECCEICHVPEVVQILLNEKLVLFLQDLHLPRCLFTQFESLSQIVLFVPILHI